jgi:Zn-dependent protease
MKSLLLGQIMGIKIELHSTFILLIILVELFLAIFSLNILIPVNILILFLFLSVFIHELFHSIVAVKKGFKVKKIILLPIGGISLTEDFPTKPKDEFLIAIAGPLFNFIVVFSILILVSIFPWLPMPSIENLSSSEEIENAILSFPLFALLWVNLILGAFNLFLPALPLDGGRVFRSLLAIFFGTRKATAFVTKISLFIAIFLVIIGFFGGNILIAVIGFFIWFSASQENETVQLMETMKNAEFKHLINFNPKKISYTESLKEAFNKMKEENIAEILVELNNGFGLLKIEAFEKIPKNKWETLPVKIITEKLPLIELNQNATQIMQKFISTDFEFLPVIENGKLIGVIERNEMRKLYRIKRIEGL